MIQVLSKAKSLIGVKDPQDHARFAHLSYRSAALQEFNDHDLHELEIAAASTNKKLGITGVFIYSNGDFFQSIEGPPDSLEKVWSKILADNRHSITEVQPLSFSSIRMYSGWNMRLFKDKYGPSKGKRIVTNNNQISDVLLNIVNNDIWPEISKKFEFHLSSTNSDAYEIDKLAHLLVKDPSHLPEQLLNSYYKNCHYALDKYYSFVIGPLASHLGDLSAEDVFNEFEVTIALHRILCFFRKLRNRNSQTFDGISPKVNIINMPGENQIISSVIDYEILWQAGMNVSLHFPRTDEELIHLIRNNNIDILDLSQSPIQFKNDQLPRLKTLIENIHTNSLNSKIKVIIKGRGFSKLSKNFEHVGADLICNISSELKQDILDMTFAPAPKILKPIQIYESLKKTIWH